jgi:glucose/arabinose dehydrogenase
MTTAPLPHRPFRPSFAVLLLSLAALALASMAVARPQPARAALQPSQVTLSLSALHSGFVAPVAVTSARDGSGRLFVVEQRGTVKLVSGGKVQAAPYIDMRGKVSAGDERGLLSLAFHPRFKTNGQIYAAYTDAQGALKVVRLVAGPRATHVAPTTELPIITIPHPGHDNHNGGQLAFGPDGDLYIGTGDGGGGGDPANNAQNRSSLLGKVLRIDLDSACCGRRYVIPSDNPYFNTTAFKREILHYGLRNPWRFSFDRRFGNLWVADVGQDQREEIDLLTARDKGRNLGWDCREATIDVSATYGGRYCAGRSFTSPLTSYPTHAGGRCSVIGGFVYRGARYASLIDGMYVYADFCSGELFGITHVGNGYVSGVAGRRAGAQVTAFGEDDGGELFAVGLTGLLYRVTAARR